jgi:putative transposase
VDLPGHSYAITSCVYRRRPLFGNPVLARLLIDLYVEARDREDILLHGYVVMPEHYHAVLTLRQDVLVTSLVRRLHSAFARRAKRDFGIEGRIWQRRFYDHVVRDGEDWWEQVRYIHENPVRAGLVENAVEYQWSSCAFWETGEGLVECAPA